ncbi:MAG: hypothetical protein IJU65_04850 [Desulfovibrio sp.]|nr:hypothetical protein [Desulfovibrio sp.]
MATKINTSVTEVSPKDEKEVWVRVDQNGNPLPDQNPSAKETEATFIEQNRTHAEALGDVWSVLTGHAPTMALMGQVVSTVMHEGGTRPCWQWKRAGKEYVLLAWPQDQPVRASVLLAGEEKGKLSPVTAAPLLEGLPNDLTVEAVYPWANGVDADVAVSMIEGKNPMWFYDPLYGRDKEDLTPGITHTFLLAGLALALRKALIDEITITQGATYEAYAAEWLAENSDKSRLDVPPLKVDIHNKHLIMPGRHFCEYQMRAVVEEVEEHQLEKMPVTLLYLSFPFEKRSAMRLPVYVSKMVLGDYIPQKGEEVDAYVWLQGRVIDMDETVQS